MRGIVLAMGLGGVVLMLWNTSCAGDFCMDSSQCEAPKVCLSNTCRFATAGAGGAGPIGGGGGADGGGASSSGGADAGMAYSFTLTGRPTAVTLSDTSNAVFVAIEPTTMQPTAVERYSPLQAGTMPTIVTLLGTDQEPCSVGALVHRGSRLYAGCEGAIEGTARAFAAEGGSAQGAAVPVSPPIVALDHQDMVAMVSAAGNGGAFFRNPSGGSYTLVPRPDFTDNPQVGAALVDGLSGVDAALFSSVERTGIASYRLMSDVFTFVAAGTVQFTQAQHRFITSGRRRVDGTTTVYPVLIVTEDNSAHLFDGSSMIDQTNQMPMPMKTFANLSFASSFQPQLKVTRDSRAAYYLGPNDQLCKLDLTPTGPTTASCTMLPAGCGATDVAPRVGATPSFVACGSLRTLEALPF